MTLDGPLLLAVPIALLAGLVSFASPCILPLVPGYLGYVSGFSGTAARQGGGTTMQVRPNRSRMVLGAALFVLGIAVVFVLLGTAVGGIGFWFSRYREEITQVAGVIVLILGVVFIGGLGPLQRIVKPSWSPRAGVLGAPLVGAAFAVGWSPCVGPTLGAIYAMAASSASAAQGGFLSFVYAIGLGLPFVLVALGFGWATTSLAFLRRHIRAVNVAGGVLLIVMGLLMLTGVWNTWTLALQGVVADFVPAL